MAEHHQITPLFCNISYSF